MLVSLSQAFFFGWGAVELVGGRFASLGGLPLPPKTAATSKWIGPSSTSMPRTPSRSRHTMPGGPPFWPSLQVILWADVFHTAVALSDPRVPRAFNWDRLAALGPPKVPLPNHCPSVHPFMHPCSRYMVYPTGLMEEGVEQAGLPLECP
jgi:hypothetical protein